MSHDPFNAPRPNGAASDSSDDFSTPETNEVRLSYKFQRLRERLRAAIVSGEFGEKLPGERHLARRFRVNAKTLSKALTDLAAEGLLERSIGRGTFVKQAASESASAAPSATKTASSDRWLVICDQCDLASPVIDELRLVNPSIQIVHDTATLRPSFLSAFKAVIDFSHNTPDSFLRDMLVRNATVVLVGREPSSLSLNAVVVDRVLAATFLARDLMLAGHRRFVSVERAGTRQICDAILATAERYAPDALAEVVSVGEMGAAMEFGATAILCDTPRSATAVRARLDQLQVSVPEQVSLAAIGSTAPDRAPCTGYFVSPQQKAAAIVQQIRDGQSRRPRVTWLVGSAIDAGTLGTTASMANLAAGMPLTRSLAIA